MQEYIGPYLENPVSLCVFISVTEYGLQYPEMFYPFPESFFLAQSTLQKSVIGHRLTHPDKRRLYQIP